MTSVKYYKIARSIDVPKWATHVAVSTTRENYAEPCRWCEKEEIYIDEPPSGDVWAGTYKSSYWVFIQVESIL